MKIPSINAQLFNRKHILTLHNVNDLAEKAVDVLIDQAAPNEFYTFQILVTSQVTLEELRVTFNEDTMTCFNTEGIDATGKTFKKALSLKANTPQVLWCGIQLPGHSQDFKGQVIIEADGCILDTLLIQLTVTGDCLSKGGVSQGWRQSRLKWLNSTLGQERSLTKPYIPLTRHEHTYELLGHQLSLSASGFPKSIISYYNNTQLTMKEQGEDILAKPITLYLEQNGEELHPKNATLHHGELTETDAYWEGFADYDIARVSTKGHLEFDGFLSYTTQVVAKEDVELSNIHLSIPYSKTASTYAMGLGLTGGKAPDEHDWAWNDHHQNSLWMGASNKGLKCTFKAQDHEQPFVNVYYNQRPLKAPQCWSNHGLGGIHVYTSENARTMKVFRGTTSLKKGDIVTFVTEFLVTPLKPIDFDAHWNTRYYHPHENAMMDDNWVQEAKNRGANYTNIHHGHDMHPFINYPFIEQDLLRNFVDSAHSEDIKVKLYYTLRELTNHIHELWPFYSLQGEIFPPISNENLDSWNKDKSPVLTDTFGSDVIPAWQHVFHHGKYKGDVCASLLTNPTSRLNNFYIAGLDWLLEVMNIDGIYIDDVAYDRKTMQRVRRLMDRDDKNLIDLHSWSHMNGRAGYVNSALLYMELFPYINSLWFGEGFNYDGPPDYWFTEISGIPFGLMGQMLQHDGHPYRGMVYGMATREGWGKRSPIPFYNLWDSFDIKAATMHGYWSADAPITCNQPDLRVTSYVKEGQTLIAIGSWSPDDQPCQLDINWAGLGLEEKNCSIYAPDIKGLQTGVTYTSLAQIAIPAKEGLVLIIKEDK